MRLSYEPKEVEQTNPLRRQLCVEDAIEGVFLANPFSVNGNKPKHSKIKPIESLGP
jgi:hypothetical protein